MKNIIGDNSNAYSFAFHHRQKKFYTGIKLQGFYLLLFSLISAHIFAQSKINNTISAHQDALAAIEASTIFTPINTAKLSVKSADLPSQYDLYKIDAATSKGIANSKSEILKLEVPFQGNQLTLELVKANIFAADFKVSAASNPGEALGIDLGVQYWGKVSGYEQSMVAISFSKNEMGGVISFKGGNYNLGKVKDSQDYIFYRASDFEVPIPTSCHTDDLKQVANPHQVTTNQKMDADNCVGIYLETAYDMFLTEGSVPAVFNKVVLLMSQVFVMFANESINMNLSELVIWNVPDPYAGPTTLDYLEDFRVNVPNTAGDLVHLLSYDVPGGVAYLDQLCGFFNYGYSGIFTTFNNVPTYSWTINVITHELGHNLGSPHTHACVWNGNNTAIDGCGPDAGFSEGCNGPIPPSGTIMSYCHLINTVGINFNLGFGAQPGNLIRTKVYNAPCLSSCGSDSCINDLNLTSIESAGLYEAVSTLSSTAIINSNFEEVIFHAGNSITLNPGFLTDPNNGSHFEAKIEDCISNENSSRIESLDDSIPFEVSSTERSNLKASQYYFKNYPNPFSDKTTFEISLSQAANISISVYDAHGKLISTVQELQSFNTGLHQFHFNGQDYQAGIYYYSIQIGDDLKTGKLFLIK